MLMQTLGAYMRRASLSFLSLILLTPFHIAGNEIILPQLPVTVRAAAT